MLQSRHMNVYGEFKSAEFTSDEILALVQILSKYRYSHHSQCSQLIPSSTIRQDWAMLSLEWSIQIHNSHEPQIAADCLKLFIILNENWDLTVINKLCLFLFKTLMLEEKELTFILFDIFAKLPSHVTTQTREIITTLGNCLLQSSSVNQMRTGLNLLKLQQPTKSEITKVLFKG